MQKHRITTQARPTFNFNFRPLGRISFQALTTNYVSLCLNYLLLAMIDFSGHPMSLFGSRFYKFRVERNANNSDSESMLRKSQISSQSSKNAKFCFRSSAELELKLTKRHNKVGDNEVVDWKVLQTRMTRIMETSEETVTRSLQALVQLRHLTLKLSVYNRSDYDSFG